MVRSPSWQSYLVNNLVRARMRPHAYRPIDPVKVRRLMGRPRFIRQLMAMSTGATHELVGEGDGWPGGEIVTAPDFNSSSGPVMLYLHGGGYIGCSPETHRSLAGSLAVRLRGQLWVPDYRLAPENPYPAALEDALSSYSHLLRVRNVDPKRLIVAGDSAGGGLAVAMVLAARDRSMPLPAALVTYSPWTDMAITGDSIDENSDKCAMFAGDTIRRAAVFYVGDRDPRDPLISPLYGTFAQFPPVLIHASTDEVLRDDSVRLASAIDRDGGTVKLRLWRRVPHVWQFFPAVLPEAQESLEETREFVERILARTE